MHSMHFSIILFLYIYIYLFFLDRLSEESIRGLISYAHLERIPSQIDRQSGYEVETVQYFFSELGIKFQRNLMQNFENNNLTVCSCRRRNRRHARHITTCQNRFLALATSYGTSNPFIYF